MTVTANRSLLVFAAANGALAVALGAFGAHSVGPEAKALLTTGAQYQMVHAALAVACALLGRSLSGVVLGGWLASVGGLVFSLALALIALAGLSFMGAVAPVGGALMIIGWGMLLLAALRHRRSAS